MTTSAFEPVLAHMRRLIRRPRVRDGLFLGAMTVLGLLVWAAEGVPPALERVPMSAVLLLGQTLPLHWRRSHPWTVLTVVTCAHVLHEVATMPFAGYSEGMFAVVAGYFVARYGGSRTFAAVPVVALAVVGPPLLLDRLGPAPDVLTVVMVVGVSVGVWMLGESHRRVHAHAGRLAEIAARLRAEQDRSARRAVAAERAGIARDLHDLVAHHISAISMQAKAGAEALPDDPGLHAIGVQADRALEEMRRLVGLLSASADSADGGASPSLRHLDRLVATAEAAGCEVRLGSGGTPGDISAAVQVTAYRIVQEALTNVLKHAGPTTVDIDVRQEPRTLTLSVTNGPPAARHSSLPGSGLGLIGMRERAALFAGTLEAGPTVAGGWRVEAVLTWEES
ncbi:sensor histidine kinase [Sinosporangium siamense]|uniref:sensor histidine kinase n=1 Tax=Sinosporangium siamense TaxID=1367973 RepID=UPI0019520455|nr:histidine kinase [Sinosporangium siamense]